MHRIYTRATGGARQHTADVLACPQKMAPSPCRALHPSCKQLKTPLNVTYTHNSKHCHQQGTLNTSFARLVRLHNNAVIWIPSPAQTRTSLSQSKCNTRGIVISRDKPPQSRHRQASPSAEQLHDQGKRNSTDKPPSPAQTDKPPQSRPDRQLPSSRQLQDQRDSNVLQNSSDGHKTSMCADHPIPNPAHQPRPRAHVSLSNRNHLITRLT